MGIGKSLGGCQFFGTLTQREFLTHSPLTLVWNTWPRVETSIFDSSDFKE